MGLFHRHVQQHAAREMWRAPHEIGQKADQPVAALDEIDREEALASWFQPHHSSDRLACRRYRRTGFESIEKARCRRARCELYYDDLVRLSPLVRDMDICRAW